MATSPIAFLHHDPSLPNTDAFRDTNTAAVIRFITAADPANIDVMNRFSGDLVQRFNLNEAKINELVSVLNSNPALSTFDNSNYVLCDGSHAFTGKVAGITPTTGSHLTTKAYVDNADSNLSTQISGNTDAIDDINRTLPLIRMSPWQEFVWSGGTKKVVDLTLSSAVSNADNVATITVLEKLDIAQPTISVPNPTAVWVYRQLFHGTTGDGLRVDDFWLQDLSTVRVLLPSTTSFSSGYPSSSGYAAISNPRQRFLRATVIESQGTPDYAPGILRLGDHARLVPIANGFKIQVSVDGVNWQDGPDWVAT